MFVVDMRYPITKEALPVLSDSFCRCGPKTMSAVATVLLSSNGMSGGFGENDNVAHVNGTSMFCCYQDNGSSRRCNNLIIILKIVEGNSTSRAPKIDTITTTRF